MPNLNLCQFIGRLGKDPESTKTPNGNAVSNFSIAVSKQWTDKETGLKKEKTTWVRIVAFNRLAEICNQYLKRGSLVYISGDFVERQWKDQNSQDRWTTEIRANQMQMLGGRNDTQPAQNQNNQYVNQANTGNQFNQTNSQPQNPSKVQASSVVDDDLPF